MKILKDLEDRKILKDITNKEKLKKIKKGSGVYIGFDPTAKSLHLGNYIQIALLIRMKKAGFKAFAVIGGATGMIGDPSGKSNERKLLNNKTLNKNKNEIKKQLEKYGLEVIDNYEFYKKINFLNFLREIGKKININYMINKDIIASRIKNGISFTEFTYQLIQGYDFYKLYKNHNILIQMGGSDQWGNITTGIELIRKIEGNKNLAVGITSNLMTTSLGKKFGKSEKNTIWLSKKMTSPYILYQYLLNINDKDVKTLFNWLTFLNKKKIQEIIEIHNKNKTKKYAQKELAKTLIIDIHSNKEYLKAIQISKILFGKNDIKKLSSSQIMILKNSIPTSNKKGKDIQDFLVNNNIVSSRKEAKKAIENSSIKINATKITSINLGNLIYKNKKYIDKASIIKKGKKQFFLVLHKN